MEEADHVGGELTVDGIVPAGRAELGPGVAFDFGKMMKKKTPKQRASSSYNASRLAKETPEKRAERLARMRAYAKRRREQEKEEKEGQTNGRRSGKDEPHSGKTHQNMALGTAAPEI